MHCGRRHLAQTLVVVLGLAATAAAAPRYELEVGDHMVFERRVAVVPPAATQPTAVARQQLQYWVLSVEAGRATVLAEMTDVVDGGGRTRGGLVFEIDDRGRLKIAPEFRHQLGELGALLEPWPEFYDAFYRGEPWHSEPDAFGRVMECSETEDDPKVVGVDFELRDDPEIAALLEQGSRGHYEFDPARHLVTRYERSLEDHRHTRGERVAIRLYLADTVSEAWIRQRREEADRFAQALRVQWQYLRRLTNEPREADRTSDNVRRIWSELVVRMVNVEGTPVRRLLSRQRQWVQDELETWRRQALMTLRWLGRQADFAGVGPAAAADLAGRPVLTMYWRPDEPDSVRMLPKLAALRAAVGTDRLGIVCVNVGGDESAVEHATKICGEGVAQASSEWPLADETPVAYPVWRVSDASGKITRVAFGWCDDPSRLIDLPD